MSLPSWVLDAWARLTGRNEDRHELDDPITDLSLFVIGAAIQVWCTWHLAMLASWAYGSGFTGWVNVLFYDAFALAALRVGTDSRRSSQVRSLAWFIALLCFTVSLVGNLIAHHVFDPAGRLLAESAAAMIAAQPFIRDSLGSAPVLLLVLSLVLVASIKAQKRAAVKLEEHRAARAEQLAAQAAERREAADAERAELDATREHETRRHEADAEAARAAADLERAQADRAAAEASAARDQLAAAQLAARTAPAAALPAGGSAPDPEPSGDPLDELRALADKLDLPAGKTAATDALLAAAWDAGLEPPGAHLDQVVGGKTLGAKAIREARAAGLVPPSERPTRLTLAHSASQ